MRNRVGNVFACLAVALAAAAVAQHRGCTLPDIAPSSPVTAVTYVYEKDQTPIPPAVLAGLNRLNRERKIVATPFEKDTKDGDDQVPDQYKIPLAAAIEAGLPALVITAGDKVLAVVKAPTTEAEVLEAVP